MIRFSHLAIALPTCIHSKKVSSLPQPTCDSVLVVPEIDFVADEQHRRRLAEVPHLPRPLRLRVVQRVGTEKKFNSGLAFNSIVNDSRLLKANVPTSKICLLLLLNLLQIYSVFK